MTAADGVSGGSVPGRVVRCVGAIVHDDGRLLLVRRAHAPSAGLWSLPGGRVEPGESDADAVVRELVEETGLTVAVGAHCGSLRRPHGALVYDIHDYRCTVTAGTPRAGDDAADVGWFDAAALAELHDAGALTEDLLAILTDWHALP